jgi:hypothetical protein
LNLTVNQLIFNTYGTGVVTLNSALAGNYAFTGAASVLMNG